jgi:4-amino-4-deoxy-L-arabinose transferase-like glycosyltransferase/GT2 family glycosyltransferase
VTRTPTAPQPEIGAGPYTGPSTGQQLAAVDALELLAAAQADARREAPTAVLPVYTGPVTGEFRADADQMAQLRGEWERAESSRGHRKAGTGREGLIGRHGARFASFSVIGAAVLALGIAVQALLVRAGAGSYGSYAGQALFSIEASFALNRYFTWRDRPAGLRAWWRFNVQKVLLTVPNLALYALAVQLGAGWLAANLLVTAVFTVVNYVAGDQLSFAAARLRPGHRAIEGHDSFPLPALPAGPLPPVSIVIPCKANEKTIRATVDSLLGQDYPELAEVICVGDPGDSTWAALAGIEDPRLVLIEQEKTPGQRDPNVKRDKGLRKASGDVLALADSDIVMGPGWLSGAVALLARQGGGLVAGGMRAIHGDRYWPRFVDRNALAAKTSRLPRPYEVTAANFGARGRKPPLTANAVFTRGLYEACPLDAAWAYGYEDYEWYWRLAKGGHRIQYHGGLTASHHHREKSGQQGRGYRRSAQGCAQFVRRHPGSPLAVKRRTQAAVLPVTALAVAGVAVAAVIAGYGLAVALLAGTVALAAAGREAVQSRSMHGLAYPAAAAVLAGVFTVSLAGGLLRPADREAALWDAERETPRPRRRRGVLAALGMLAAAGTLLRGWDLAGKPDWQVDEITYTAIAKNLLASRSLSLPTPYGQQWMPFLFHPPFYFLLLARWFAVFGAGVTQARALGVACAVATLLLGAWLAWSIAGGRFAAIAAAVLATDGWLLYIERCSYIENVLMLLVMAAFLAYQKALRDSAAGSFAVAGVLFGAAVVLEQTGLPVLLGVAAAWLMTRRSHKGHLLLLGTAGLMLAVYTACMAAIWGRQYEAQAWVQVLRSLGLASSRGTLSSPGSFAWLATHQYAVFSVSLAAGVAGICWLAADLLRSARARRLLVQDPVIAGWLAASALVFGASSIRYAQYFELVLVPAYLYLWLGLYRRFSWRAVVIAVTAAALAGTAAFGVRALGSTGNAFAETAAWMRADVPHSAVVTAESSLGYDIPQPYCEPSAQDWPSALCEHASRYLITWQTYLQSDNPLGSPAIAWMIAHSRPVKTFSSFEGEVVIREMSR